MHRYYCVFGFLLVAVFVTTGCGGGDKEIKITGTAKLDGSNLQMGLIRFEPRDSKERTPSTQIMTDGTFTVYAIKPGKYKVAVKTSPFAGAAAAKGKRIGGRVITIAEQKGEFRAVPKKYEDAGSSGLVVEVKAGEPVNLELKSGG